MSTIRYTRSEFTRVFRTNSSLRFPWKRLQQEKKIDRCAVFGWNNDRIFSREIYREVGHSIRKGKGAHSRSLFSVSVAKSKPPNIATPSWMRRKSIARLPPSSMLPVPIYTPGWRETKWSKVPCLRKQRDGRALNTGPPDPEVLTARPHTPPRTTIFP